MNNRFSPGCTSDSRSPSTSHRRSPPSSIACTIARSRCVRSAPIKASASSGSITRGSVRGVRISGTPRTALLGVRVDNPCGTGFFVMTPRMIRYSNRPVTEASRRLIVRADSPASPSSIRTTPAPRLGWRWAAMKDSTSAASTSSGHLPTTVKNTFKSNAAASTVFARARAATISR